MCVKLFVTQNCPAKTLREFAAPVGTTVIASEVFSQVPVRRRIAKKSSLKTISSIIMLLQSYALARPSARLMLKVPKSKIAPWSYIPARKPQVREAILQIFGRGLLSCCNITAYSCGRRGSQQRMIMLSRACSSQSQHVELVKKSDFLFEACVLSWTTELPGITPEVLVHRSRAGYKSFRCLLLRWETPGRV